MPIVPAGLTDRPFVGVFLDDISTFSPITLFHDDEGRNR